MMSRDGGSNGMTFSPFKASLKIFPTVSFEVDVLPVPTGLKM